MHTYIYIYMFLCWCVGLSIFHVTQFELRFYAIYTTKVLTILFDYL